MCALRRGVQGPKAQDTWGIEFKHSGLTWALGVVQAYRVTAV